MLILIGSIQLQNWLWPKPPKEQQATPEEKPAVQVARTPTPRVRVPKQAHEDDPGVRLGDADSKLRVILDPWGAGVRSVTLNQFQEANELGEPRTLDGQKVPLELVQDEENRRTPSNLLYHFDPTDEKASRPLSKLGKVKWDLVEPRQVEPGHAYDRIAFATTVGDVRITKTFTLNKGDYHIGLEVKVELVDDPKAEKKPHTEKFRYQVAGSHGLRMEGVWYTPTHRDALILKVDSKNNGRANRVKDELRRLSHRGGGDEVAKGEGMFLRYGAVTTQYFVSGIVVSDQQVEGVGQDFIATARATVEESWLRGKIESIGKDARSFELDTTPEPGLFSGAPKKETATIVLAPGVQLPAGVREGSTVAVRYTLDDREPAQKVADEVLGPDQLNRFFFDDITVRLNTEWFQLEPGKPVVHNYLLYNGPAKVRLLGQLEGDKAVPSDLVERYHDTLRLDTFTDYQSNSGFGEFAHTIGWTRVLIFFTNLMHGILWYIHQVIPNYGLCIIVLTLLVRACMFPLSRKQTLASQRMQEKMARLKPEIEKLKEKYKNDPQAQKQAQTELMLKHGMMNPLGSCWIALLQMPIFMGLYYALQESIHFRLAPFAWIDNLAAPDMLIKWGQSIPIISSPSNYSGGLLSMLYLGPFFNLLPVIAVGFMIAQQSMMMPPATDEQQAAQQKMMKYMTVFFGLLFYKVAAGLCIYFIISSVWGFCERKLLPKKQAGATEPTTPDQPRGRLSQWVLDRMQAAREAQGGTIGGPSTGTGAAPADSRERRVPPKRPQRKPGREAPAQNGTGFFHKIQAWWQQLLKEARKK